MLSIISNSRPTESMETSMAESYPDALALSRKVLRVLIYGNLLMGFLILLLLIASLINGEWVMTALSGGENTQMSLGMRAVMVVGICSVPFAHVILSRLRAIVETVKRGDPFVA